MVDAGRSQVVTPPVVELHLIEVVPDIDLRLVADEENFLLGTSPEVLE